VAIAKPDSVIYAGCNRNLEIALSAPTVVFDLDGTLVDTVATRIAAWIEALAAFDYPTERDQLGPLIGLDGKRLASEIAALAGRPIDEAMAEEIDKRSGEIYERLNRSPRALPGVRRLIEAIEDNEIRWAIATSSRKEQVKTSIAALQLPNEPTIVDASHVKHAKPEPDLLLLAAKEVGVEPAHCWYVGDSTWDMVSAVAAGMIAIGVCAGSAVHPGVLEGAGAAAVVPTLDDIADAFGDEA
jgi:HAD superfamily hydrolase (TIGR01509 family)